MMTKHFDSQIDQIANECIAVRLRMLNRVVTNIYDNALRSLDLKVSQMNILVATAKMGIVRPADMCDILNLDVSTLSRNVERMKQRGWLQVVPESDGRAQPFQLTFEGRKLLEDAIPAWQGAQEQVMQLLGEDSVTHFNQAIKRINQVSLLD
ncbi:MAG: winged helix-turn-helix transcriptional regulator [Methylococcaceae bacterium]|nr:winged helix-turn-helix transcriptional regulator [Methylococcaceae bacterium]